VELTTTNGHKQNSGDESDEETQTEQAAIPAAAAAVGVVSGDETKPIDPNEPDPINRRRLFLRLLNNNFFFVFI